MGCTRCRGEEGLPGILRGKRCHGSVDGIVQQDSQDHAPQHDLCRRSYREIAKGAGSGVPINECCSNDQVGMDQVYAEITLQVEQRIELTCVPDNALPWSRRREPAERS